MRCRPPFPDVPRGSLKIRHPPPVFFPKKPSFLVPPLRVVSLFLYDCVMMVCYSKEKLTFRFSNSSYVAHFCLELVVSMPLVHE